MSTETAPPTPPALPPGCDRDTLNLYLTWLDAEFRTVAALIGADMGGGRFAVEQRRDCRPTYDPAEAAGRAVPILAAAGVLPPQEGPPGGNRLLRLWLDYNDAHRNGRSTLAIAGEMLDVVPTSLVDAAVLVRLCADRVATFQDEPPEAALLAAAQLLAVHFGVDSARATIEGITEQTAQTAAERHLDDLGRYLPLNAQMGSARPSAPEYESLYDEMGALQDRLDHGPLWSRRQAVANALYALWLICDDATKPAFGSLSERVLVEAVLRIAEAEGLADDRRLAGFVGALRGRVAASRDANQWPGPALQPMIKGSAALASAVLDELRPAPAAGGERAA